MSGVTDLQLSAPVVRVAICAYLDILGEPLKYALAPLSLTMPALTILNAPNPDFDGATFTALDPRFITMSPVQYSDGGAQRVDFTVSGSLEFDSDLLTALSDPARFRGRSAAVWAVLLNTNFAPIAARQLYYGYMAVPAFGLSREQQSITISAENYITIVGGGAPARSLLSQQLYDVGDLSAAATLGKPDSAALGPEHAYLKGGAGYPAAQER